MSAATFGFPPQAWQEAKLEAIRAIVRAGRQGKTITYSDLAIKRNLGGRFFFPVEIPRLEPSTLLDDFASRVRPVMMP